MLSKYINTKEFTFFLFQQAIMLQIAYIAKLNQTNSLILDAINTHFDANVVMVEHKHIFNKNEPSPKINPDLVIFDLNTSVDLRNAPDKIEFVNDFFSNSALIVIHPYSMRKFIEPLMKAGANGIIPIAPSEDEVVSAVKETLTGKNYISFS